MSSSTADLDRGDFHIAGDINVLYRGFTFVNRDAWVTFGTHSWPATRNSKVEGPYRPACVRSVTSRLRSVRLCTTSASWCWITGWNVPQKLDLCLFRSHVHTKVTWSPWLPFMISFLIWVWCRSRILKNATHVTTSWIRDVFYYECCGYDQAINQYLVSIDNPYIKRKWHVHALFDVIRMISLSGMFQDKKSIQCRHLWKINDSWDPFYLIYGLTWIPEYD